MGAAGVALPDTASLVVMTVGLIVAIFMGVVLAVALLYLGARELVHAVRRWRR